MTNPSDYSLTRPQAKPPFVVKLSGGFAVEINVNIYHHTVSDGAAVRAIAKTLGATNDALADTIESTKPTAP